MVKVYRIINIEVSIVVHELSSIGVYERAIAQCKHLHSKGSIALSDALVRIRDEDVILACTSALFETISGRGTNAEKRPHSLFSRRVFLTPAE